MRSSQQLKPLSITQPVFQKISPISFLSPNQLIQHLTQTISHCKTNLLQFQQYIQLSFQSNLVLKEKLKKIMQSSVKHLQNNFRQFIHSWKIELPLIFTEFMQIVKNICILYQQQIERLKQINTKWEVNYKQLLKLSNNKKLKKSIEKDQLEQTFQSKQQSPMQLITKKNNSNKQISNLTKSHPPPYQETRTTKQPTSIVDYLQRIKQSEISLMQEQITQLFQQDQSNSMREGQLLHYTHQSCFKGLKQNINKINLKINHEKQHNNIDKLIKQCRFKTMNDENPQKNPIFLSFNALTHSINKDKDYTKQNVIKCTNSQKSSKKSLFDIKQHFWQTMRCSIDSTKAQKSTKSKQNIGKQKIRKKSISRGSLSSKNQQKYEQVYNTSTGGNSIKLRVQKLKLKKKVLEKQKIFKNKYTNQIKIYHS